MEEWRSVLGGAYEVSDLGRARYAKTGLVRQIKTCKRGYAWLTVANGCGSSRNLSIARLVCEAFNGPAPDGMDVDHINRIRSDNRPCNLRWVTRAENLINRVHPQGEKKTQAKLSARDVSAIRQLFPTTSNTELGARFGVHRRTIADIRNEITWKKEA